MSTLSTSSSTRYSASDDKEPFLETPLTECTSNQIKAKIEFLEKNNLLLTCECDALELNSIKVLPELAATKTIDISWMPYNIDAIENHRATNVTRVKKLSREKFRQSVALLNLNKNVHGSIYSIVTSAVTVDKVSINHLIIEIEKAIININVDFDKKNNTEINIIEKIENETENIEYEIKKQLQHIESYSTNVLVGGFNKLTKRIPADKYEKFVKNLLMSASLFLNDLQFKMTDAITEQTTLREQSVTLKHLRNTVSKTEIMHATMINKKLSREENEIKQSIRKIKQHISVVHRDYLKKKYHLEKFELSLGLPSLDAEIKCYKNKLLRLTPITQKITVALESNVSNDTHGNDNTVDDDKLHQHDNSPKETLDDRINHYLEVKMSIGESDKYIKFARLKLDRQNKLVQLYTSKLKNKNILFNDPMLSN